MNEILVNGRTINLHEKVVKTSTGNKKYLEAKLTIGKNPITGKQIQKSFTGQCDIDIINKIQKILPNIKACYTIDMLYKDWLLQWFKEFKDNWSYSYISKTAGVIKIIANDKLGNYKINDITRKVIQSFLNELAKKDRSRGTIKNYRYIILESLEYAKSFGYIRINPTDLVRIPNAKTKLVQGFTRDEVEQFVKLIKEDKYRNIYMVCLITGLRIGEVLALDKNSIDRKNHKFYVHQHLVSYMNEGKKYQEIFPTTKTGRNRLITVADMAFIFIDDELKKHNQIQIENNKNNLIFIDSKGNALKYQAIYKNFKALVKMINRDDASIHCLRHTAATMSLEETNDLKAVQELLGHMDPSMTLRYVNTSKKQNEDLANKINDYYKALYDDNKIIISVPKNSIDYLNLLQ